MRVSRECGQYVRLTQSTRGSYLVRSEVPNGARRMRSSNKHDKQLNISCTVVFTHIGEDLSSLSY